MGWDALRSRVLQNQIDLGLFPTGTQMAARPDGMPAWESLNPEQRKLYARQMEVFAGALSYAEHEFGRILDTLEASGELDNTLIIVTSDNGASAEEAANGTYHEQLFVHGVFPTVSQNAPRMGQLGGPDTYPHYAFGWAVAGKTRVPLIVSWPNGILARGELRRRYVNVVDIAPTILESAGATAPTVANNTTQRPMEGESIAFTFSAPDAPDRKLSQYSELYGNKGLWSQGWQIVTSHRTATWDMSSTAPINEPWELYNLTTDPGQTRNLAAQAPDRVARMGQMFEEQARRFNVFPLSNMSESRRHAQRLTQDDFARRGGVWRYPNPTARIAEFAAPPILFGSYRMTAHVRLATGRETGPLFAMGARRGGAAFYLRDGRPTFILRDFAGEAVSVSSSRALRRGENTIELSVARPSAAPLTPIDVEVAISANGRELARKTLHYPMPVTYSVSDTFDIGRDDGAAVSQDYAPSTPFPGEIRNIVFDFRQTAPADTR